MAISDKLGVFQVSSSTNSETDPQNLMTDTNKEPSGSKRQIELLNRIIVLAQWDKKLPAYVARLFSDPDQYQKALEKIRWGIKQAEPAKLPPSPSSISELTTEEWQNLYSSIAGAPPLRQLFMSDEDPFSGITSDEMFILSGLADISTDSQTMLYTQDGAFMDVLATARQLDVLDTNKLITEGLEKFLILLSDAPEEFVEMVYNLASSTDWQIILASLRDRRDYTGRGTSTAAQTLDKWDKTLTTELRSLLFRPNQVARVPKGLIQLAWTGQALFEEAKGSIPPEQAVDKAATRKHQAAAALPLFRLKYSEQLDQVESNLRLRFDLAQHFIAVRRFAKLDAFVYFWPEVARRSRPRYRSLVYVEGLIVMDQVPSDADLKAFDAKELYELCAGDKQLSDFLRLPPQFREINENLFIGYKPMASGSADVSLVSPAAASTPLPTTATTKSGAISKPPALQNITIRIGRLTKTPVEQGPVAPTHEVTLSFSDQDTGTVPSPATLIVPDLLKEMLTFVGVQSVDSLQVYLKDLFSRSVTESKAFLVPAGSHLLKAIFAQQATRDQFSTALHISDRVRVIIQMEDQELSYLPWEWLPDPSQDDVLVRMPTFSLLRCFANPKIQSLPPLTQPLRVLVVMPNPTNLPTLNFNRSISTLESVLPSEKVQLRLIVDVEARLANLRDTLKSMKPHIVHFEGHVSAQQPSTPTSGPHLQLESGSDVPEQLDAISFARDLTEAGVQLLVCGNNDFSYFYNNPVTDMAASLVKQGLPAVLAATRAVDDDTATTFTSEFYRSFLRGQSLEQAISDARQTVSTKKADWSAFALFANPTALDFFNLLPSQS